MVLAKKDPIEQNWQKLEPIWTQNQNYLKKLDENWDQKGILTKKNFEMVKWCDLTIDYFKKLLSINKIYYINKIIENLRSYW